MRVLFFARAQEAVPLGVALGANMLVGGMTPEVVEQQIEAFKANPDGIMVATAAFQHGWRANVEAAVFFLEGSFIGNRDHAAKRVNLPHWNVPTVETLMDWLDARDGPVELPEPSPKDLVENMTHALGYNAAPCKVRSEQDEYVCSKCGLRWAVDDVEPPICPRL